MTIHNSKPKNRRRGQAFVETAFILVPFLAILIGALDFGQLMFFRQSLVERVRSGLRWGSLHAYDETSIRNVIRFNEATPATGAASFLGLTDSNIAITRIQAGQSTERIQIAIVDYQYSFFSPLIAKTFTNNLAVIETLPIEYRP